MKEEAPKELSTATLAQMGLKTRAPRANFARPSSPLGKPSWVLQESPGRGFLGGGHPDQ